MIAPKLRLRWRWWVAGAAAVTVLALLLARLTLMGIAINALLQLGGASAIRFTIKQASPWTVVVEDLAFQVRTQAFAAKRVTMARAHWWLLSLGAVSIEQARVPWTIDGSDTNPASWATYQNGTAKVEPMQVPVETLSVDGQLVIQAAALPAQELTMKLAAKRIAAGAWQVQAQADGPGLSFTGRGDYDYGRDELAFVVPKAEVDLQRWQAFVQRLVVVPGGPWELAGKISGRAEGRWGKKLVATATVQVRDGEVRATTGAITATGITADLEFTDVAATVTRPGALQVAELRTGQLALRNIQAGFSLAGANRIAVGPTTLEALGGKVTVEPFNYYRDQQEVEATVAADGLDVEAILALTQDLPARAKGRVSGRLPVRLDSSGVRLGTGWLALTPGVAAEIEFHASGLLTGGAAPGSPSYAVLQKIEAGLLRLKLSELRLDIRPPNADPGRSAQLHLKGAPVDPEVKAPVILDLNVNGPLEQLLNLGLDSRVSFGSKR